MKKNFKFFLVVIACFLMVTMLTGFISSGSKFTNVLSSSHDISWPSLNLSPDYKNDSDSNDSTNGSDNDGSDINVIPPDISSGEFGGVLLRDLLGSLDPFEKTSSPEQLHHFSTSSANPVLVSCDDSGLNFFFSEGDLTYFFFTDECSFDVSLYDYALISYTFNTSNFDSQGLGLRHHFATFDGQNLTIPELSFVSTSNYEQLNIDFVFKFDNLNMSNSKVLIYINDEYSGSENFNIDFNVYHILAWLQVVGVVPTSDFSLTLEEYFIYVYGSGDGTYDGAFSRLFENPDVDLSECVDSLRFEVTKNENE